MHGFFDDVYGGEKFFNKPNRLLLGIQDILDFWIITISNKKTTVGEDAKRKLQFKSTNNKLIKENYDVTTCERA